MGMLTMPSMTRVKDKYRRTRAREHEASNLGEADGHVLGRDQAAGQRPGQRP